MAQVPSNIRVPPVIIDTPLGNVISLAHHKPPAQFRASVLLGSTRIPPNVTMGFRWRVYAKDAKGRKYSMQAD